MLDSGELNHFDLPIKPLMQFLDSRMDKDNGHDSNDLATEVLPMRQLEYFMLVDHTGRAVSRNKRGRIDPRLRPIFERLGLSGEQWMQASTEFGRHYRDGDLKVRRSA